MNISKSKNSVPLDKPLKIPQPDILSLPLQPLKLDMLLNTKNKQDAQSSTKALELIKQINQSSTGNLRLDTSLNKSKDQLLRKTPTKSTASFHYEKSQDNLLPNQSYSPHTHACLKPQLRQVDESIINKTACPQKQQQNTIKDQCERIEQLNIQLRECKQQLSQKESDNQRLQEHNIKLNQENQNLYQQQEQLISELEYLKQNFDLQNREFMNIKQQNQQLLEDVKLIKSERNKQSNSDQIINQKNKEISQLQNELNESKQLLQAKDSTIKHLKEQFENLEKQQYEIMTKLEQKDDELQNVKQFQQQQINFLNPRKSNQFESQSRRSSVQSEVLFYQAQIEQLQKEKEICEQKLVEMQTSINQFALNEKKINAPQNQSQIQQKDINKMKQIIQIQKRQIESQQKTIMNQHYEIQNLQTLLYCSTDDGQVTQNKKSFSSNEFEKYSQQSPDIYHISDKENEKKQFIENQSVHHLTFQQQYSSKFVMEDTFRNLDNELNQHNTLVD